MRAGPRLSEQFGASCGRDDYILDVLHVAPSGRGRLVGRGGGLARVHVCRLEDERGFKLNHRARYEGFIATLSGNTTFDEAASAGRELSLEQAVDYVLVTEAT